MKTFTTKELANILDLHKKWLNGDASGVRANLRSADLSSADLRSADLSSANLSSANLSSANLRYADLRSADLSSANLSSANLSSADLSSADLSSADLSSSKGIGQQVVAGEGLLIGYKKVWYPKGTAILKLVIPKDARRVNAIGSRKCRCDKAKVIAAYTLDGRELSDTLVFKSYHERSFLYELGKEVVEPKYNPSDRVECTDGIHFFITFSEAAEY